MSDRDELAQAIRVELWRQSDGDGSDDLWVSTDDAVNDLRIDGVVDLHAVADAILTRWLLVPIHRTYPLLSERYGPANTGETPAEKNMFSAGALWWAEQIDPPDPPDPASIAYRQARGAIDGVNEPAEDIIRRARDEDR